MKMTKRLIAFVLAFVMIITSLPLTASAAPGESIKDELIINEEGLKSFEVKKDHLPEGKEHRLVWEIANTDIIVFENETGSCITDKEKAERFKNAVMPLKNGETTITITVQKKEKAKHNDTWEGERWVVEPNQIRTINVKVDIEKFKEEPEVVNPPKEEKPEVVEPSKEDDKQEGDTSTTGDEDNQTGDHNKEEHKSYFGTKNFRTITVINSNDEVVEDAKVVITLRNFLPNKLDDIELWTDENGKIYFDDNGYERIMKAKVTKEGYNEEIKTYGKKGKYIGLVDGINGYFQDTIKIYQTDEENEGVETAIITFVVGENEFEIEKEVESSFTKDELKNIDDNVNEMLGELNRFIRWEDEEEKEADLSTFVVAEDTLFNAVYEEIEPIVEPITAKHVLYYFNNIKEVIKTEELSKKDIDYTNKQDIVDAYKENALEGYILDTKWEKENVISYDEDTNTLTFKYWAREVKINYVCEGFANFKDSVGPLFMNYAIGGDANEKFIKDDFIAWVRNEGYAADVEIAGVVYDCKDITVEPNTKYNNVIVTITYQNSVQANCNHEIEYTQFDSRLHDCKCSKCEKDLGKERHEIVRHRCVKCGYIEDGQLLNVSMNMPKGLYNYVLTSNLDDTIFGRYLKANAYIITDKILEEEETLRDSADEIYAEDDGEDILPAIIDAYNNHGISMDELHHVMYESNAGVWYDITITFNRDFREFSMMELGSIMNFDEIDAEVAKRIKKIVEDELKEDAEHIQSLYDIEPAYIAVKVIPYGVYDVEVNVLTTDDEEIVLKGKIHTYKQSRSRRKKPKTEEIDDEQTAQAGGLLNDLRTNRPDEMITRSEFVGAFGEVFSVLDGIYSKNFNDIAGDANEEQIKRFSSHDIVKGYCDEEFGTNDYITNEQMLTILARAFKFVGKANNMTEEEINAELSKALNNVEISDWAREGVAVAMRMEVTSADDLASNAPLKTVLRLRVADVLEKFIKLLVGNVEA